MIDLVRQALSCSGRRKREAEKTSRSTYGTTSSQVVVATPERSNYTPRAHAHSPHYGKASRKPKVAISGDVNLALAPESAA